MRTFLTILLVAAAAVLQTALRRVWEPLAYADLPLILTVYFALQRDTAKALFIGAGVGTLTDALGGGLLGASGFAKTIVAYILVSISNRFGINSPLIRVPVLAGATLLDAALYFVLHKFWGQNFPAQFVQTSALRVLGTTIAGSLILLVVDAFFSEQARQRRGFSGKRRKAQRYF